MFNKFFIIYNVLFLFLLSNCATNSDFFKDSNTIKCESALLKSKTNKKYLEVAINYCSVNDKSKLPGIYFKLYKWKENLFYFDKVIKIDNKYPNIYYQRALNLDSSKHDPDKRKTDIENDKITLEDEKVIIYFLDKELNNYPNNQKVIFFKNEINGLLIERQKRIEGNITKLNNDKDIRKKLYNIKLKEWNKILNDIKPLEFIKSTTILRSFDDYLGKYITGNLNANNMQNDYRDRNTPIIYLDINKGLYVFVIENEEDVDIYLETKEYCSFIGQIQKIESSINDFGVKSYYPVIVIKKLLKPIDLDLISYKVITK